MTIDELKALFQELEKQDLRPMLCDTEVPLYDASVPCGDPAMCGEDCVEMELMPKELLSIHPEFMVTVKGDSMKDVGIVTGDVVKVVGDLLPQDGDIVLANINGEYTLKTYYEDEDGQKWLVPQNEAYHPIMLSERMNLRIYGKVAEIVKRAPRVSFRQCKRVVERAKTKERGPRVPTPEEVSRAIREIAPKIKIARHWYAVFRVLVDRQVIGENGYGTFINKVKEVVPSHAHLPSEIELQRLAVQSFAKTVALWRADNAPVKGKRFSAYLDMAHETESLLDVK
jgi:hypothetical protein